MNSTKGFFDDIRLGNSLEGEFEPAKAHNYFMLSFDSAPAKRLFYFLGIEEKHLPYLIAIKFVKEKRVI